MDTGAFRRPHAAARAYKNRIRGIAQKRRISRQIDRRGVRRQSRNERSLSPTPQRIRRRNADRQPTSRPLPPPRLPLQAHRRAARRGSRNRFPLTRHPHHPPRFRSRHPVRFIQALGTHFRRFTPRPPRPSHAADPFATNTRHGNNRRHRQPRPHGGHTDRGRRHARPPSPENNRGTTLRLLPALLRGRDRPQAPPQVGSHPRQLGRHHRAADLPPQNAHTARRE